MGADLGFMVLIALGSMKLTELYKEVTRRMGFHAVAWQKTVLNIAICTVLTVLIIGDDVRTKALIALGAAGLSALLHALDTVLRSHRDDMVQMLTSGDPDMIRRRRRR